MGRQARAGWRKDFLKALARTGNAALAARRAGVDKATAYNLRHRDIGFALAWARAKGLSRGRVGSEARASVARSTPPPPFGWSPSPSKLGEELVVRFNKREGAQLVAAGRGRWSGRTHERFDAALKETGNVRAAAAAAGISTTALYNRRRKYPLLEAEWAAAKEIGCRRVSLMLIDAAEAALDPDVDGEALGLPRVTVAEALAILKTHGWGGQGGGFEAEAEEPTIEEVRDEVLRRLAAMRRQREGSVAVDEDSLGGSCQVTPPPPFGWSPSPSRRDGEAE